MRALAGKFHGPVACQRCHRLSRPPAMGSSARWRRRCGKGPGAGPSDAREGQSTRNGAATPGSLESDEEFSVSLQVRDYELDQFGVVNNQVYAGYAQHARHVMMATLGFSCDEVARRGEALAITEMEMKFTGALRSEDTVRIAVKITKLTPARCTFRHRQYRAARPDMVQRGDETYKTEVIVNESFATVVALNSAYRPVRIDADLFASLRGSAS
ncbi:unnamed protein product [Pedinophyceae sp. YPF-701]|nr:unnamed protein product [Pedinophyceae sp. YPF-701]